MTFKKAYISTNKSGRQLFVGDIHGCYKTFLSLLNKVQLQKEDQLIILGDVINKGPDAKGVIDHILSLQKDGFEVYVLRGNNESLLLKVLKKNEKRIERLTLRFGIANLLKKGKTALKGRYRKFFKSTLYYIEGDKFFAVHAGFDYSSFDPFNDTFQMLWMRNFKADAIFQDSKPVIHGHRVFTYKKIQNAIKKKALAIPLDNGCVLGNADKNYGRLICYDLTNRILYKQRNIEDFTMSEFTYANE